MSLWICCLLRMPTLFKLSHACENYVSSLRDFHLVWYCVAQSLTAVYGFEKYRFNKWWNADTSISVTLEQFTTSGTFPRKDWWRQRYDAEAADRSEGTKWCDQKMTDLQILRASALLTQLLYHKMAFQTLFVTCLGRLMSLFIVDSACKVKLLLVLVILTYRTSASSSSASCFR